jgi:hypothetical protein
MNLTGTTHNDICFNNKLASSLVMNVTSVSTLGMMMSLSIDLLGTDGEEGCVWRGHGPRGEVRM